MPNNTDMHGAIRDKKDEFYTQLSDIEKELAHYTNYFKGKTILCNCDDPAISNFFKFFSLNFEPLKLKKLITICYKNQQMKLFSQNKSEQAIYLEYSGDKNNNRVPDINEIGKHFLKGDGDFKNQECINILKRADIICTNPPFSLFKEYLTQLTEYKKKFIIIGNVNAISYKETFRLLKENKLWLGASIHSGDREFGVPDSYPLNASSFRVDENGKKFIRVKGVRWFTNIDYNARHEDLTIYKKYNKADYQKYDHYNAINVDKVKDIPDYDGLMGVPITFMDKFSPNQFEIIDGLTGSSLLNGPTDKTRGKFLTEVNGKRKYARIIIKRKRRHK